MSIAGGEIPEYSLAPRGGGARPSRVPWIVTVLALAGGGFAAWRAFDADSRAEAWAHKANAAEARVAAAEAAQKDAAAKLAAAESEKAALQAASQNKDEELQKLKGTYDQLQDKLKGELKSGDVSVTESNGKLRVDLVDKVLFNSGEAQVSKRGENVLLRLGAILAGIADKQIVVSGHTDETPIGEKRSAQFPSNWELSVARATNVVRFLQEKASVPGERLVASGYGEFHPIASNKTAAGRARNRRIEILLLPSLDPKKIARSKLAADVKPGDAGDKSDAKPDKKAKAIAKAQRHPR
jgi:chemotaxis protein MotB